MNLRKVRMNRIDSVVSIGAAIRGRPELGQLWSAGMWRVWLWYGGRRLFYDGLWISTNDRHGTGAVGRGGACGCWSCGACTERQTDPAGYSCGADLRQLWASPSVGLGSLPTLRSEAITRWRF